MEKNLPETVASNNIDYRSATLMQLIDNASFLNRYVRRLVETVTIYETQDVGIYETYQVSNMTKGEALWIEQKYPFFLEALLALSTDSAELKKKFDNIPMVKVDTGVDDNDKIFGWMRMDPFKLGFIPVWLNPCYHFGKWIVELQAWRHKEAQEDLKRITMRVMLLEQAIAGKSDPKLEKELSILRTKSEELTYKINKAEEEL